MFNFIKNLFLRKAKSLDDFIRIVKEEMAKSIIIYPGMNVSEGGDTISVGVIGKFMYSLNFEAKSRNGRKIVFNRVLFERFGSQ